MTCTHTTKRAVYLFLYIIFCCSVKAEENQEIDITNQTFFNDNQKTEKMLPDSETYDQVDFENHRVNKEKRSILQETPKKIRSIIIQNNTLVSQESIKMRLPYKEGDDFDVCSTSQAIKNVFALNYFRQVQIFIDEIDNQSLDLYVVVTEKPKVNDIVFEGNNHLSTKDIKKEAGLNNIPTVNEEELKNLASKIKNYYHKKNYHFVEISHHLETVNENHVIIHFNIKENKKSYIRRIFFKNNHHVSSKKLKRIIFSRELWILSPLDHSGSYQPQMIEGDKALIEDGYKSNGFINAKVSDVEVVHNEENHSYDITYTVHEGEVYHIKDVTMQGNDLLSEEELKSVVPIREGQRYSVEMLRTSIENLRLLWGESGYIFADIEPAIDIDEENKTISINFYFDLKDKVYLNRLNIKGNKKARDKIIRRQVLIDEGDLITNKKMEQSKNRIKMMGYFDEREGVNWKKTRIDDTHADLDLMLKEVKTGKFNLNMTFGGGQKQNSPSTGLTTSVMIADRNLYGSGIATSALAEIAKKHQSFTTSIMSPWMFDKPIKGVFNAYHRRSEYEDGISYTEGDPHEIVTGGFLGTGYASKMLYDSIIEGQIGFETISFDPAVTAAKRLSTLEQTYYQIILDRSFQSGDQYWAKCSISQDRRNGLAFTSRGYQWNWYSQIALPMTDNGFKYFKTELDASWYTPLIGETDLVLCMHAHLGFIRPLGDKNAPWKSLFHMGGPSTIRGYTYGQVGPTWNGDSMGATKAFHVNTELIMPLTADQSARAVIFYDGGAGWDVPYAEDLRAKIPTFEAELLNNKFFYRHSVGAGIRITRPTPIQVDFGIKLNPAAQFKKKLTEVHFSMTHEF